MDDSYTAKPRELEILMWFFTSDETHHGKSEWSSPEDRSLMLESPLFNYRERGDDAVLSLTDAGKDEHRKQVTMRPKIVIHKIDPDKAELIRRAHGLSK